MFGRKDKASPTGKSIKDQSPASAKPAAASASSDKQVSEDNAASRAAAGEAYIQHYDRFLHLAAAYLHACRDTGVRSVRC